MFLYNDNLSVKSKVAYISTSFWLLADGSRDLSQGEKEIIVYQAQQIHEKISTQNIGTTINQVWIPINY